VDVIRINLGFSYVAPIIRGQKWLKKGHFGRPPYFSRFPMWRRCFRGVFGSPRTPKKVTFLLIFDPSRLRPPFFPFSYVAPILSGSGPSKTLKNPSKWRVNTRFSTIFEKSLKIPMWRRSLFFKKHEKVPFFAFFRLFGVFSAFLAFFSIFYHFWQFWRF